MYKTILGDEWDMISFKVYGTDKLVGTLMKANAKYAGVHKFEAGIEIEVPKVEEKKKVKKAPWK